MNLPPPNRGCSAHTCDECDLDRESCPAYRDGSEIAPPTWHRVYVAGPLSAPDCTDYLVNVHQFVQADVMLRRHSFAPFNPSLDLLTGIVAGDMDYEAYFLPNLAWLDAAEAVYLLGHSPGADRECARAAQLGIPVFDNLAALMEWRAMLRRTAWEA
jgi:hypothetical protein